ncbi:MAG: protein kinase domain-containing protein [Acidimicrobiales bacterium]
MDVLRLAVASVLLLVLAIVGWWAGTSVSSFLADLFRGLDAVPSWLADLVVVGTRLLATVAFVAGLAAAIISRRGRLLLTIGGAGLVAAVLAYLVDQLIHAQAVSLIDVDGALGPLVNDAFPSTAGVAVIAAMVTAAAPWLTRRWRHLGAALVIGTALSRFVTAPVSLGTFFALVIGWFSGSLVLVVFGGPVRRPDRDEVAAGMAQIGLVAETLEKASVDARGSTPWFATTTDGTRLFVKALGRDERSADLLFRTYRTIVPHDFGDERSFSSLRRTVEHEAMVAMAARELGVRTPPFVALASVDPDAFVLVYELIAGASLDGVAPERLDDGVVAQIWSQVALLRSRRIAHRDLRLANIFLGTDDRIMIIDFGFSEVAASDLLLATDLAELLASLNLAVGVGRSVDAAVAGVGAAALADAATRLKPYALSGATRAAFKQQPGLLDELRERVTNVS